MIENAELTPTIWYRRHLPGAEFSLEANTGSVPKRGRFYVLRRNREVFSSRSFNEALTAYHELCRPFWEAHLNAEQREERLAAAWGLIGLEPNHPAAVEVIRKDGDLKAQSQLTSLRRRHQALRRKASFRKPRAVR